MSTKKTAEKKQTAHKISFIDEFRKKLEKKAKQSKGWEIALNIVWVFMMLVWVAAVLVATQLLLRLILVDLMHLNESSMSSNALQTLYSALVYVVSLVITVFVPWKLAKSKTTRDELGLRGLPTWTDILLAPVGFIVFIKPKRIRQHHPQPCQTKDMQIFRMQANRILIDKQVFPV